MKRNLIFVITLLFSILLSTSSFAQSIVTYSGKVKNQKTKKPIENVSLTVPGSNISTVTNADGYFSLKVPEYDLPQGIKVEQIGYQSKIFSLEELSENPHNLNLFLMPSDKPLKELVVLGGDPKEIVYSALEKIPENYSDKNNLFTGFYRETVQKGNRFISISEAMVDVLKKPYHNRDIYGDMVNINKGRSLLSQKASDTLAVKIAGGPYMSVALDVVKNGDHLFTVDEVEFYEFKMEPAMMIDDRLHYAISFKPKVSFSYPLHSGILYIDAENQAINRVEFALDMKDKNKVTNSILKKKPKGLHFKPQEVSGVVTYKLIDGKSYLNYINSKMRFKCDWKKRLFSSGFTTVAEMVMVDRDENPDKHRKFKDKFNQTKVFSDVVDNYWEENFWKDYNIIEPTESLEKAVIKLKKK